MSDIWIPWIYQYAVGGAIFFGSLFLAWRSGALRLGDRNDRRLCTVLVGGYFLLMAFHGAWIHLVS